MKKIIALLMTTVLFIMSTTSVFAYRIGDVIGASLVTDIVAQINGYDIASYNCQGFTYVIAEDLANYGFGVNYNNYTRTLSITRNYGVSQIYSNYKKPAVDLNDVGKTAYNLLYTDIVTYLDGRYINSYNINGQTIIAFDDLASYGYYVYDNNTRRISLDIPGIEKKGVGLEELNDLWKSPNRIKFNVKDNYGKTYDKVREVYFRQKYLLDGEYTKFTATYFCPCDADDWCKLKIYTDGELVYETKITGESKPVFINLDISECNVFEITESQNSMNFKTSYFHNATLK